MAFGQRLPLLVLLLLAVSALIINTVAAQECTNPQIRREWSELSEDLKRQYVTAVKALAARPHSGQTADPRTISYSDFVDTHTTFAYWAHKSAQFLVYHRAMLHMWDLALRTVGWTYGPVYWDWTLSSQSFIESNIFTYFGSIGRGPNNCLVDGEFSQDKFNVSQYPPTRNKADIEPEQIQSFRALPIDPSDPYGATCLRRCSDWTAGVLWPPEAIRETMVNANDYDAYRTESDGLGFHATVHQVVGGLTAEQTTCGDMADGAWSTNDPIFFLHHGMVDKLWFRWQSVCSSYKTSYGGLLPMVVPDPIAGPDNPEGIADASQAIDSWPWRVRDMLDTQGGMLCYTYSRSGGDLPVTKECPAGDIATDGVPPVAPPMASAGPVAGADPMATWLQSLVGSLAVPAPGFKMGGFVSVGMERNRVAGVRKVQESNGVVVKLGAPIMYGASAPTRLERRDENEDQYSFLVQSQKELDIDRAKMPHPFPPLPEYAGVSSFVYPDLPHVQVPVPKGYHVAMGRNGRPIVVPSSRPNATSPTGYGSFPKPVVDVNHPEFLRRRSMNGISSGMTSNSIADKAKMVADHLLDEEIRRTGTLTVSRTGRILYSRPVTMSLPPLADDKDDEDKLRYATVLSDAVVAMMGWNLEDVRELDAMMMRAVDECNYGGKCESPAVLGKVRKVKGMMDVARFRAFRSGKGLQLLDDKLGL
ncbi:hypothetical protein HDU67_000563 [Dinochytrium kinnereticum]|nr:hypothetical protein HDU67_000563 [Dinochytrium kinnereticum]